MRILAWIAFSFLAWPLVTVWTAYMAGMAWTAGCRRGAGEGEP